MNEDLRILVSSQLHLCKSAMAERRKRSRKGPPKLGNRPSKYRKWTEESMAGGIKCVALRKMGVNRAADQYGIPRTMFKDRLSGRVTPGTNPGPVPYLTSEEDDKLIQHLLTCADIENQAKSISDRSSVYSQK